MTDRRKAVAMLIVILILVIATGFVTHVVDVYFQAKDFQQELMRYGFAAGGVAVFGMLLLVALVWLLSFLFPRKSSD